MPSTDKIIVFQSGFLWHLVGTGQDSDGGRSVSLGASQVEGSERNHMNQAKAGDMTRNVIEHKE